MDTDDQRRARVLSRVEGLLPELAAMLATLKGAA
jgi:hypothetical protein